MNKYELAVSRFANEISIGALVPGNEEAKLEEIIEALVDYKEIYKKLKKAREELEELKEDVKRIIENMRCEK